jgi:hypothetical protein
MHMTIGTHGQGAPQAPTFQCAGCRAHVEQRLATTVVGKREAFPSCHPCRLKAQASPRFRARFETEALTARSLPELEQLNAPIAGSVRLNLRCAACGTNEFTGRAGVIENPFRTGIICECCLLHMNSHPTMAKDVALAILTGVCIADMRLKAARGVH